MAVIAIALHLVLIMSAALGSAARRHPRQPDSPALAAEIGESGGEFVSTLILIDPSQISSTPRDSFGAHGVAPRELTLQVIGSIRVTPVQLSLPEEATTEESPTVQAFGDGKDRALLFGRYMNQISARIDRAWIRPRTDAIDAEDFQCRVRILQDSRGKVQEVEILECGQNPQWQQSLVSAIERASPLPAPPHPAVFVNALVLGFRSDVAGTVQAGSPNEQSGTSRRQQGSDHDEVCATGDRGAGNPRDAHASACR
jgi:hypothetical protein